MADINNTQKQQLGQQCHKPHCPPVNLEMDMKLPSQQKTKQSLLNLGTFIKNPKKITVTKHKYLEVGLEMPTKKRKPYVDKDKQKRLKEEKRIEEGCEGWRHFMAVRGIRSNDDSRAMLFANGPPPDPYKMIQEDREERQRFGIDVSSSEDEPDYEFEDAIQKYGFSNKKPRKRK
jgi:hypothetical protein